MKNVVVLFGFIGVLWAALLSPAIVAFDEAPPQGWTTQAELVRILDGDTIEVEISRKVKIRLLDCWAPERRDDDGPASTANLKRLLAGTPLIIHVPVESGDVEDIWTFGRVLGTVWRADCSTKSVNSMQVDEGHATKEKQ